MPDAVAPPSLVALIHNGEPVDPSQMALGPVSADLLDDWYSVERPRPDARPWTIVGMITSIDGATTVDGGSGPLGNHTDRLALGAVRRAGQVVIVGAGTVRNEDYQPTSFPHCRVGVVTGSAKLNFDGPLFSTGVGFVITSERAEVPTGIDTVRSGADHVDLEAALASLDAVTGPVHTAIIEGGPTLNGSFIEADLVDEICVTTAPLAVGGASDRLAFGDRETPRRFAIEHLLFDTDGYSLTRWRRHRAHQHD